MADSTTVGMRMISTTPGHLSSRADVETVPTEELPQDNLILEFNIIIWALVGISGFVFFLRAYCKISRQRGLWWDDHVMGAAWFSLMISCIFGSISTTRGFGKHSWNIDTEGPSYPTLLLIMNHTGFWSIFGAAWSKTSFAITLLRISDGRIKWLIWFIIATVNITLTLTAIFMWVQCNPPRKSYTPTLEGECWNGRVIVIYNSFAAGWSGLADIVLAIMPWWIIARHSMNLKERIGLLVCMSLGVFAGLTSIAKIVTLPAADLANKDLINTVPLNILGIAEAAVTIFAASIPVLRALLGSKHASRDNSAGLITAPKTGTSQAWREYEALDKDGEPYNNIELTKFGRFPDEPASSSRIPTSPNRDNDPWRRF
ncbi:uncharacterized protein DNG_04385 [Cephalotrichum gorgonifer]|uniref:Rhodopsin domain-containing protein n=1 Tax=Cephalotrichum gorgonifer TaxID=2041049 RepID=A0AAE8SV45_9PEZI|nr:uncharacterized protein DNG_04385 [Cephalotrichum gorgonifer]